MDHASATKLLQAHGQLHVLSFWERLDAVQRTSLLGDIRSVDWPLVQHLCVTPDNDKHYGLDTNVSPPQAITQDQLTSDPDRTTTARQLGHELLRQGRIAALTVAGGQGTRLGFAGPKGLYNITPLTNKSLFQHFAEGILATHRRYGCKLPWLIMTSSENNAQTVAFFEKHNFFGLPPMSVRFFQQGMMPAVTLDGRVLLAEPQRIALAPDGHGGTLRALRRSGILDELISDGVRYLSYFQVDNPLIPPLDPLFSGLAAMHKSEFGSKVVGKAFDEEKVGVFVNTGAAIRVVEYTNLPAELCSRRNEDGSRTFDHANIACHLLETSFLQRITAGDLEAQLPYHRALKKVPYVDTLSGQRVDPPEPNAIKFEQLIFDAVPMAGNPLLLEVPRQDEFSPVKNAEGVDSPQTAREHMVAKARRWVRQCDAAMAATLHNDQVVEISPLFALDVDELKDRLPGRQDIEGRESIYLGP